MSKKSPLRLRQSRGRLHANENETQVGKADGKTEYDAARFERLKQKHSDDLGKLAALLHEQLYRVRRRAEAAEAKAIPAGAVVLSAEQAQAWDAYQKLGAPEAVGKALADSKQAAERLAKIERQDIRKRAAEAHGYDPDAFLEVDLGDVEIELSEVTEGDEKRPQALVKDAGGTMPLPEYLGKHKPKLAARLKADAKGNGNGEPPAKPAGTQWPPQNPGGKAPKGNDIVAQTLARNRAAAEAPNPLKPAAPATK